MTKARRLRMRGPLTPLQKFLYWKKGPLTTERLAIFLIIVLCYANAQMILAIYAEEGEVEIEDKMPHIDLGLNPVAQHEAEQAGLIPAAVKEEHSDSKPKLGEKIATNVEEGDIVASDVCPPVTSCPSEHIHIYAEGGPRRVKVCLNGEDVLPAWKTARGLNFVVINSERGTAGSVYNFDTYQNPGIDMVDIIKSLNEERMVVFVSQDEASTKLSMEARLAIEKLGSTLIHDLGWRDSWAFIGQVGTTTISPYEAKKRPIDSNEWAVPVALSQCVPTMIDSPAVLAESHHEFCATYDNYGDFCKRSWKRPVLPSPVQTMLASSFPIMIVAGNRGGYLRQVIASMFKAPGFEKEQVVVFQDGYEEETFAVARQFGIRLVRFPKTDSSVHKEDTFNHADHIATNYKRSLDIIWEMYPSKEFIIVMEDDLIVAPDFFDYFSQLVPVLKRDKTLFSASAWNDNGYQHASSDPSMIYRTQFFPGLGWLMSHWAWMEVVQPSWPKCCQGHSWDLFMREVLKSRGLDTLYPDVSRTFHIGKEGANVFNEFFNGYFRQKVVATGEHNDLVDLDKLDRAAYITHISDLISIATPVDWKADPCDSQTISEGRDVLVMFYYQRDSQETRQALALAGCLHLWNVDIVRGMFNGVLRTHYRGNELLLVGSMTKFGKDGMPADYKPFRIAKYKDEMDD